MTTFKRIRRAVTSAGRILPATVEHKLLWAYFCMRDPNYPAKKLQRRSTTMPNGYSLASPDRLNCIFVHVPKTAGISVAMSLFGDLGPGHMTLEKYRTIYSPADFDRFFKFAFIRNPWDRLVSAFHYLKKGGMNDCDRDFADRHLARFNDFDTFVKEWVNPQNIMRYYHFQPQTHFLSINGRRPTLDFVGRFEDLQADYEYVRNRLGAGAPLRSENRTSGRPRHYASYYNDVTRRIVADAYAKDISIFGYSFDNSSCETQAVTTRDTAPEPYVDSICHA